MIRKLYRCFGVSVLFFFSCVISYAQSNTVTGTIKDDAGMAMPGVNVIIKGTTNGTSTDSQGAFSIQASPSDVLVVSFIGYATQEIAIGNQTNFEISLAEDLSTLEEVVVVGYGEQKKKLLTGANVQVSGEKLQQQNQLNPLQALQGQAPGVAISSTSGQPGSMMKVVIRGLGTIGNSGPLYVIDGVPGGDIAVLNPNDIKSIDILKDAASAAIYGAQSANGVVLVTTKTGSQGKAKVTFDAYTGIQNVGRKVDMLNAEEYKTIMNEQALNSGAAPIDFASMGELADTDWMNYMFKDNARTSNYSLGITGGSENSRYAISMNYIDQEGIVGGKNVSYYERYGFRTNSEHKLYDGFLKIGQHLNFNYTKNNGINVGNQYNNTLRGAFTTSPLSPVYSDNNLFNSPYNDTQNSTWYNGDGNPYGSMMTNSNNSTDGQRLQADVYAELEPVRGLKVRSLFGFNYYASENRSFTPLYQFSVYSFNTDHTTINQNMSKGHTMLWTNTASYDFTIQNKHIFSVMVGTETQRYQGTNLSGSNWNLLSQFNDFSHAYLGNTTGQPHLDDDGNIVITRTVGGGPENQSRRLSYFGRVSYNYDEKYLFNATIRRDGSSNFAPGHQWGVFPSFSAGWIVTYEDFMESSSISNWLNFFKLRASWGQVGNQNIDPYQFAAPINTSTSIASDNVAAYYTFGTNNTATAGAYQKRLANLGVKWETSEQTDIGFDAQLMENRLQVTFDYYIKNTKDWLVEAPILATAGAEPPVINGGSVKNTGVELALAWNDNVGELNYQIGVNGAYNKNTVGSIPTEDGIIHGDINMLYDNSEEFYRAQNGFPIGYFWGYETAGIFQSEGDIEAWTGAGNGVLQADVKPGDVKYVDRDNNGRIDSEDKTNLGSGMPDVTLGFNVALDFKGFDLSVNAFGAIGNEIVQSYRNHSNKQANYTSAILNRWTGEGTSNRMPRVTETNVNWQFSDLYIHDGDYLRISNISLGYDFSKLIKLKNISKVRVYVQAQNLFTFTKYNGMDPEIGYGTDDWATGVDLGYYPRPKIVMAGVNLQF
ncbi:MAG TPA: TonB-dependent receptor [Ohtaekwangia sp.]|nr:TonB-dependent receptor [Ohtaekwangia sp.]